MLDIIIIGAGTAGISAYKEAVKWTQHILIINDGAWDTTCARVGCMPSKVLISSANRLHDMLHADEVALAVKTEIDTSQVMSHVRTLRDRFTHATLKDVNSWPEQHKISGRATFVDAQTVEVNGKQYQAKSFILAVGSTPIYDEKLKAELAERLITSDQVFELEQLPKSLAVIGSGVIAIELAQAMQRLGVKTTVFARSRRVGIVTSPDLQSLVQQELSKELTILFETLPKAMKRTAEGVQIDFEYDGQEKKIEVDYVLSATGRQSLLSLLALENIQAEFSDIKTLPIDAQTKQLADYPIFVVGDAFTSTPVQHEATHEGKGVVQSCLNFPTVKNVKTLAPLGIVFSQPEMASVGKSYQQLKKANVDFMVGKASYEKQGRAIVLGKNQGALEVYIDRATRRFLGAELFIDHAEHLATLLAWMLAQEVTLDDILNQPFYHPTLEEGLRTAFKHARRQLNAEGSDV